MPAALDPRGVESGRRLPRREGPGRAHLVAGFLRQALLAEIQPIQTVIEHAEIEHLGVLRV
jgi:hypothetical protein